MPDDDWALGSTMVDFRNEQRRWAARHGGPVEEPPQDVFLSDDPALGMVHADMGAWLRAHRDDDEPFKCETCAGWGQLRDGILWIECPDCEGEGQ